MITDLPNLRYERKFVARGASLAEALLVVKRHPAAFREAYPPRAVNNVYFDSPSLHDYFDHVNGATHRLKVRLRWYGLWQGLIEKPVLEQKIKRGLVSGKVTQPMPALTMNGGSPRGTLMDSLATAQLPGPVRARVQHREPTLGNRYHRHYFHSADGRFRLTVDSQLQFLGLRHSSSPTVTSDGDHYPVIIELKYDPQLAEEAVDVASELPFRMSRCSKYVLGIEGTGGA